MPKGVYIRKPDKIYPNQTGKHWKLSDETKRKISEANKGKTSKRKGIPLTEEHKQKISKANKGKKRSDEANQRNSETHKGFHHTEETKKKMSLSRREEKHYNWQGGLSRLPYSVDWTKTLRQSIRERDHYQCQVCGEKQGDEGLSIHHIDYDKKNCNLDNLISLCRSCHLKTNFNRDYWLNYFKQK